MDIRRDNTDTLVRDLDTLSIQHEIEMDIDNSISKVFNLDHEYKGLLEWNDTHELKIKSISGKLDLHSSVIETGSTIESDFLAIIEVRLSNDSFLTISTSGLSNCSIYNRRIIFTYTPLSSRKAEHRCFFSDEELKEFWKSDTHKIKELINKAYKHYSDIIEIGGDELMFSLGTRPAEIEGKNNYVNHTSALLIPRILI